MASNRIADEKRPSPRVAPATVELTLPGSRSPGGVEGKLAVNAKTGKWEPAR